MFPPHVPSRVRNHTRRSSPSRLRRRCRQSQRNSPVSEVPVGSAVIVGDFILAQPTAGEYKAYSAACTHQRAKITKVDGSHVICPAHGSVFDITDGSVVSGLARDPLKAATVEVTGDTATVTS